MPLLGKRALTVRGLEIEKVRMIAIASSVDLEKRDRPTPNRPPIQPIQGWVKAPDGTITLTASAPTATPQNPGLTHPHCRASN